MRRTTKGSLYENRLAGRLAIFFAVTVDVCCPNFYSSKAVRFGDENGDEMMIGYFEAVVNLNVSLADLLSGKHGEQSKEILSARRAFLCEKPCSFQGGNL
jgi:hypothetical protein